MKFRISIPLLLTSLLLGLFLLSTSSCSQSYYKSSKRVNYNRSSRIKVYSKPKNNKSFTHQTSVQKKYRIKK